MGDSFTNVLLITLIGLLATIAKIFYHKLEAFEDKIAQILIGDMRNQKDIERLREVSDDHEIRLEKIEEKKPGKKQDPHY